MPADRFNQGVVVTVESSKERVTNMTNQKTNPRAAAEGRSEWPLVILVLLLGILATNLIC